MDASPLLDGVSIISIYSDALSLVLIALRILTDLRDQLLVAVLIAFAIAILCWVAASRYSRLWNLRFQVKPIHHILCFFAALCAFAFTVMFIGLRYTEQAANIEISTWRVELIADRAWQDTIFRTAYRAVKALGLEDFASHPPPEQGGTRIPLNHLESRTKSAEVYANSAIKNFRASHPFLSRILKFRADIPSVVVDRDVNSFFAANPGSLYPFERAVDLATTEIKSNLQAQTERVVLIARMILVILFLFAQMIPFGIIGYAAYKDLRINN